MQGRGGPGMASNIDVQKQISGPQAIADTGIYQPMGLQVATAASSVMAGALGGAQFSKDINQNVLQGQTLNDPLTLHLAKMSRHHLNAVMSELKVMATQNKEQAHQLLLASPQLSKALFQAEIMLGMVPSQMLQMPNIRQTTAPLGTPIPAQNKMQMGLMSQGQEGQLPSIRPSSLSYNQYTVRPPLSTQPPAQLLPQRDLLLQGYSGPSTIPPVNPQRYNIQPGTSVPYIPDRIKRESGFLSTSVMGPSQVSVVPSFASQIPKGEETPISHKQVPQLPPEVDPALLQQVLSLTPEQLSSLPPDQQQQVIQLQLMLRK